MAAIKQVADRGGSREIPTLNYSLFICLQLNFLKIIRSVLTYGADKVLGKLITLVNIAADFADIALLALGLGLGLDIALVEVVGHGLVVGHDAGLVHGADEHAVSVQVDILLHGQRQEGIDIPGQEHQAVVCALYVAAGKFIWAAAAGLAELL